MAREKDTDKKKPAMRDRALEAPPRNWFDFHPRITIAFILFGLILIFYHPLVFQGQTFGSPDSYAPAGFSRIGQDAIDREHVYPLWNPYIFCGMPSFASLAFNPYVYPPDWPLVLIGKILPLHPNMLILLYQALAGFFMGLLLVETGLPIMSSLVGAFVFAYTPNMVAMAAYGHGSKLATVTFIPLVLWLAERLFKRARLQDLGWLALALGCQMLRAHVQIVYYTGMMMALYYIVHAASLIRAGARATKILRDGLGLALAYGLAFGLAAFLLLPVKDYQKHSVRGASAEGGTQLDYATKWSFSPAEMSTFVVPSATGFGGATYVGGVKPFTDYPNYMGLLALFLAGAGLVLVFDRLSIFAALLGLMALLISFGENFKPLYNYLFHHLPFFNAFRVPVMILVLLQFAVGLLAGRGVYALVGRLTVAERRVLVRRMWMGSAVALAAVVLLVVSVPAWTSNYETLLRQGQANLPPEAFTILVANARAHYQDDVVKVGLVLAAGLAALALLGQGTLPRTPFWMVMCALLVFDLWRVNYRIIQPPPGEVEMQLRQPLLVPRAQIESSVSDEDDVVKKLREDTGLYRVFPLDDFGTNRYSGFAIGSVGGYHPAKPAIYDDVLKAQLQMNPRFWTVANLKYLISSRDMGPGFAQPVPGTATPVIGRRVLQGPLNLYELAPFQPRAWMVGKARGQGTGGPLAVYQDSTFDPAREVVLPELPTGEMGPQEGSRVKFSRYGLNDIALDVVARSPGYLVVSELYYPDWKAEVDGKPAPILLADGFVRAIKLAGGSHKVTMSFRSPALERGLRLSLASAGAIALLLIVPGLMGLRGRSGGNAA